MKKIMIILFLLLFLFPFSLMTSASQEITTEILLQQIKEIKETQKIILEQIDKRFEQVDKRFEQVYDSIRFMQNLLIALFIAVIGSPFLVHWLTKQQEKEEIAMRVKFNRLLVALKQAALHDEKLKEALTIAELL